MHSRPMDPVYLLRVSYKHGIDGSNWAATSMAKIIVSCYSRRLGMSSTLVSLIRPICPNVILRRSTELISRYFYLLGKVSVKNLVVFYTLPGESFHWPVGY